MGQDTEFGPGAAPKVMMGQVGDIYRTAIEPRSSDCLSEEKNGATGLGSNLEMHRCVVGDIVRIGVKDNGRINEADVDWYRCQTVNDAQRGCQIEVSVQIPQAPCRCG